MIGQIRRGLMSPASWTTRKVDKIPKESRACTTGGDYQLHFLSFPILS